MAHQSPERLIFLDTETTGLDARLGHRIIEVAAVEAIDRRVTGKHFHEYVKPDRDIDPGAQAVHGISNDFLENKPRFQEIAAALAEFVADATLVIHNAPFDLGFLSAEFAKLKLPKPRFLDDPALVVDSLTLARSKFPGKRNSLDALCERLAVDNSSRNLHGALLDSRLLAEVYFALTREQATIAIDVEEPSSAASALMDAVSASAAASEMIAIEVSDSYLQKHRKYVLGDKADLPESASLAW